MQGSGLVSNTFHPCSGFVGSKVGWDVHICVVFNTQRVIPLNSWGGGGKTKSSKRCFGKTR